MQSNGRQTSDLLNANESIVAPSDRPQVTQELSENIILTTVNDLYN